jgi:hypothetical protein
MVGVHNKLRYGHLVEVIEILDGIEVGVSGHTVLLMAVCANLACQLRATQLKLNEVQAKLNELNEK